MATYYILKDKIAVPVDDIRVWSQWFETANRVVKSTTMDIVYTGINTGRIKISTVFLGLNHSYENGPPLIFETMVFGGTHDGYLQRNSTWEQAEQTHDDMINEITYQLMQEGKKYEYLKNT